MRDFSNLADGIFDPRTRKLVQEVVRAQQGGAHRAAIVTLWVAVVSDIVGKLRDLSDGGETAATKLINDIDHAAEENDIKKFLELESQLVKRAFQDFEIIDRQEARMLQRIGEDRHLCAHPDFGNSGDLFSPTVDAVSAHLRAAFDALFSKDAIAGKRREELLISEIQNESWPKFHHIGDYLESRYFHKAPETSLRRMLELLVKTAVIIPEADAVENPQRVSNRARIALTAYRVINPGAVREALQTVLQKYETRGRLDDEALIRSVGAFGAFSEYKSLLPETAVLRTGECLENMHIDDLVSANLFVSGRPYDKEFAETYDVAMSKINREQLEFIFTQTPHREHLVRRVIQIIGASASFAGAVKNVNLLTDVAPFLTPESIRDLGIAIVENEDDQIIPARDMEESLIAAFMKSDRDNMPLVSEWVKLAEELQQKADPERYYGKNSENPYEDFVSVTKDAGGH